jgi:hypothetical protein
MRRVCENGEEGDKVSRAIGTRNSHIFDDTEFPILSPGQSSGLLNQAWNDIGPDVADAFIRGQLLRQSTAAAANIDNEMPRG